MPLRDGTVTRANVYVPSCALSRDPRETRQQDLLSRDLLLYP